MDCRGIQEHLGDAIDRSLPWRAARVFQAHLSRCRKCRNTYELERLAKQIVQQKVKHISTPASVQAFVLQSLREQYEASAAAAEGWRVRLFSRRVLAPTLAGSLALGALFFLVNTSRETSEYSIAHTARNDVINQSFRNFALVRSGELGPAVVSCSADSIVGYFTKCNMPFAVEVVRLAECEWYGAATSEYCGVSFAHVLYKIGADWVYISEMRSDDVLQGSVLSLPPAAKAALAECGWYTDPDHSKCNVIVWKVDEILCTAVSTMRKEKLLALLTSR